MSEATLLVTARLRELHAKQIEQHSFYAGQITRFLFANHSNHHRALAPAHIALKVEYLLPCTQDWLA